MNPGISPDRSRQMGLMLMVAACLQFALFALGMARRSYAALAIPIAAVLAVVSALGFWVGYTMATNEWDDADFGDPDPLMDPSHVGPV